MADARDTPYRERCPDLAVRGRDGPAVRGREGAAVGRGGGDPHVSARSMTGPASRDALYVLTGRGLRAFADGFVALLLPVYLIDLGFSPFAAHLNAYGRRPGRRLGGA